MPGGPSFDKMSLDEERKVLLDCVRVIKDEQQEEEVRVTAISAIKTLT